jgi:hypothetical protein
VYAAGVSHISAFHLFVVALWWPLPFLPGVRWEDLIAPAGLTLFALMLKVLSNLPAQEPYRWANLQERHRVSWTKLMLALIGLEAVLLLFIHVFGNGREQSEPYAAWLAPLGEWLVHAIPKFTFMAAKLAEMGVPERVHVVVVAWAIAYAGQIVLAAIWAPPLWRRLRELPPPPGAALASPRPDSSFVRGSCILFVIILVGLALFHPEASELRSRKELFHEFETRDADLLYRVVFNATLYWQLAILCLIFPLAQRRARPLPQPGHGS